LILCVWAHDIFATGELMEIGIEAVKAIIGIVLRESGRN
jgi:hypothetical protein